VVWRVMQGHRQAPELFGDRTRQVGRCERVAHAARGRLGDPGGDEGGTIERTIVGMEGGGGWLVLTGRWLVAYK
jgi:hypothetical protein